MPIRNRTKDAHGQASRSDRRQRADAKRAVLPHGVRFGTPRNHGSFAAAAAPSGCAARSCFLMFMLQFGDEKTC